MNDIELVVAYHERTKHAPNRYAASLGYMDWATQPNPYRHYEGTLKTRLPLSFDNPTPPYHLLDFIDTSAPFCIESISQFFQFSLGLAAFKRHGDQGWALRCNASSGNLQPTEAYLIAPHLTLEGYQIAHYAPEHHELELLAHFDTNFFDALPKGSFLVGVSSIAWREAWKYGERSFRYCQLDAGHALQALTVSAKMLGWNLQRFDVNMQELDKLLGFNQRERFIANEREDADMLLLVSPEIVSPPSISSLLNTLPNTFEGKVNQLSHKHHPWEVLDTINDITHSDFITSRPTAPLTPLKREVSKSSGDIVLKRRSAQVMDKYNAGISYEAFMTLLNSVSTNIERYESAVHLVIYLHHVEGLQTGLYILVRNEKHLDTLKRAMFADFLWEQIEENLYFLKADNYRFSAKNISCTQDIASDGAFSLGMLTHFKDELEHYGAARYKELYWECGAIGQQLYLEATSLRLSATGIGCYLDDMMHSMLGLKDNTFQSLYHFTIGRGVIDTRLVTERPYQHRPE